MNWNNFWKTVTDWLSRVPVDQGVLEPAIQDEKPELAFVDLRLELPWHATERWKTRERGDVFGVCIHQTGGGDDPYRTNAYHIGEDSHLVKGGAAHIAYTFFVNKRGTIYQCNYMKDITWSQGKKDSVAPGDENRHLIGIVFGGSFTSAAARGKGQPTEAQMDTFDRLWKYLKAEYALEDNCIFGHFHFGKAACPGDMLEDAIRDIRDGYNGKQLLTGRQWQKALYLLHPALAWDEDSPYGVIDGRWGPKSQIALRDYQLWSHLRVTGVRDPFTELLILRQLREKKLLAKV